MQKERRDKPSKTVDKPKNGIGGDILQAEVPHGPSEKQKESNLLPNWKSFSEFLAPLIGPFADKVITHIQDTGRRVLYVFIALLLFLAGVVIIVAVLTFYGKVSGDALLFLIGTIVGYILGFSLELAKRSWFS
jgi:hypothetical protein